MVLAEMMIFVFCFRDNKALERRFLFDFKPDKTSQRLIDRFYGLRRPATINPLQLNKSYPLANQSSTGEGPLMTFGGMSCIRKASQTTKGSNHHLQPYKRPSTSHI
jgi:hypothetical protein